MMLTVELSMALAATQLTVNTRRGFGRDAADYEFAVALAGKLISVELALAMAATMIHVELAVTHGDACRSAGGRTAVTNALGHVKLVPHHNLFLERDATCRRDVFAGRGGRGLCTLPVSLGAVESCK